MDKQEQKRLQEGVAQSLDRKGEKALAALVRKYGVVGAFDRVGEALGEEVV